MSGAQTLSTVQAKARWIVVCDKNVRRKNTPRQQDVSQDIVSRSHDIEISFLYKSVWCTTILRIPCHPCSAHRFSSLPSIRHTIQCLDSIDSNVESTFNPFSTRMNHSCVSTSPPSRAEQSSFFDFCGTFKRGDARHRFALKSESDLVIREIYLEKWPLCQMDDGHCSKARSIRKRTQHDDLRERHQLNTQFNRARCAKGKGLERRENGDRSLSYPASLTTFT